MTATDLVLTCTQMLRERGVVGRFVEYFGPAWRPQPRRSRDAANMAPEYGATCGFFGIDDKTLDYLRLTGRSDEQIALVEAYCEGAGRCGSIRQREPMFTDTLELDLTRRRPLARPAPSARRTRSRSTEVDDLFNGRATSLYGKSLGPLLSRSRARSTTSATATW